MTIEHLLALILRDTRHAHQVRRDALEDGNGTLVAYCNGEIAALESIALVALAISEQTQRERDHPNDHQ